MTLLSPIPRANLPQGYLSARALADLWGVTPRTVSKKAREGKLTAVKIFGDWRFDPSQMGVDMGRKKRGYSAPEGLIRKKGSPYWYVLEHGKATSTKEIDLNLAQAKMFEMKARELRGMVGVPTDENHKVILGLQVQRGDTSDVGKGNTLISHRESCLTIPLFKSALSRYLQDISPSKAREGKNDQTYAIMPMLYFGGNNAENKVYAVDEVDTQAIYRYQDWRKTVYSMRKKRPVTGASINREVALIKHCLKKCVRWCYIKTVPFHKGEVEGMNERKRVRYIGNEDYSRICNCLPIQAKRIVETLYRTAQRSSRILTLQWKQVDLQGRVITFGQTSENKLTAEIVYINDSLLAILRGLWEERKSRTVISPYVFCNRNGAPIKSIRKAWETATKKAQVQDARIHDIRHKAITDMRRKGVSEDMAMLASGHKTRQMSQHYTHYQVEDVKAAFEALG